MSNEWIRNGYLLITYYLLLITQNSLLKAVVERQGFKPNFLVNMKEIDEKPHQFVAN